MLNQQLRAAREKKLWTMAETAKAVGVSEQTYSRWENGTRNPHISTLKMLCQAFEASPGDLGYGHLVSQSVVERSLTKPEMRPLLVTPATSAIDLFEIGLMALTMAQQQRHWTIEELQTQTESALKELNAKMAKQPNQGGISRRQALGIIAGLPLAMMGATQGEGSSSPIAVEEMLPLYVSSVPACWRLYFEVVSQR